MNAHRTSETVHNLPRREDFIGRARDIERIIYALLDTKAWIVSIDGIGGVGKSALALEVAHRLKDMGVYAGIVWVTAKRSWLTPSGIELKEPRLGSEDDLIREIMHVTRLHEFNGDTDERKEKVMDILTDPKYPYLIIVDNLDTVEDVRIRAFLDHFRRRDAGDTKAIVTSRKASSKGEYVVKLGGLKEDEAIQLIRHEAEKKSLHSLVDAPQNVLAEIADRCKGLPLALKWTVARMHESGASLSDALKDLEKSRGDVLQYIFGSVLQDISTDAREVLCATPAFTTTIPRLALEEVTRIRSKRMTSALEELSRLYLISLDETSFRRIGSGERYAILPATRMCIETIWDETPGLDTKYLNGATDYYQKFWQRFTASTGATHLDDDYQNLKYLLDKCSIDSQWSRVRELAMAIEPYLRVRGLLDDRLEICTMGIYAARYECDGRSEIWFKESIAKVYKQRGHYQEALEVFEESLSFYRGLCETEEVAETLMQLGIILEHQAMHSLEVVPDKHRLSRFQEALARYVEAWRAFKELGDRRREAQTLHLLGRVQGHLNQFDEAEKRLLESIRLKQELADPVRVAISQHELARLKYLQGKTREASELYERSIATLTLHGATKDAANAKWGYSKLLSRQLNRLQDAYQLNKEAVEGYRKQGRWVKCELAGRDLADLEAAISEESALSSNSHKSDQGIDQTTLEKRDVTPSDISLSQRIAQIRDLLVEDPITGADKLSQLAAQHSKLHPYRAELETKRSELHRLEKDMHTFGPETLKGDWQRAVHFLILMCLEIENDKSVINDQS